MVRGSRSTLASDNEMSIIQRFIQSESHSPKHLIQSLRFHLLIALATVGITFLSIFLLVLTLSSVWDFVNPGLRPVYEPLGNLIAERFHFRPSITRLWLYRALVPSVLIALLPMMFIRWWYRAHRRVIDAMGFPVALLNTAICELPYLFLLMGCLWSYGEPEAFILHESPDWLKYYTQVLVGFISIELTIFNLLMVARYVVIDRFILRKQVEITEKRSHSTKGSESG